MHRAAGNPNQALERKPSKAWARKIPALTRPITAVTVSIIAKILFAPLDAPNDHAVAQSKRFRWPNPDRLRVMICCNSCVKAGQPLGGVRPRYPYFDGPESLPFVHHAGADPISAVLRMRYLHHVMRRWAVSSIQGLAAAGGPPGRRNGNWGEWGFGCQIRSGLHLFPHVFWRVALRLWQPASCSPTAPHPANSRAGWTPNTASRPAPV